MPPALFSLGGAGFRLLAAGMVAIRVAGFRGMSRASPAGGSVAAIIGSMWTFAPASGIRTFQRFTGACGAANETSLRPGVLLNALAYSSRKSICRGALVLFSTTSL